MSIKQPIYHEFDLNATSGNSRVISLTHTDDAHVDVIELCVKQQGAAVDLTGATVIARMVLHSTADILLNDSVSCTINDAGNILIPFDNAAVQTRKGIVKIEVNITRTPDILTLQLPLWVKINGSILDDATVDPHSEGTIPELLKDAADALEEATQALEDAKDYDKLENKPQINSHTLSGNKSSDDLGLQKKLTAGQNITIENDVISSNSGHIGVSNGSFIENYPIVGNTDWIVDSNIFTITPSETYGYWLGVGSRVYAYDGTPSYFHNMSEVNSAPINKVVSINGVNLSFYMPPNSKDGYLLTIAPSNYSINKIQIVIATDSKLYIRRAGTTSYNWIEVGSGGATIVSAVVNQNGTITFTDSEGQTVTTAGNNIVTSGNQQISTGYDSGGFYFLFDDGQEAS